VTEDFFSTSSDPDASDDAGQPLADSPQAAGQPSADGDATLADLTTTAPPGSIPQSGPAVRPRPVLPYKFARMQSKPKRPPSPNRTLVIRLVVWVAFAAAALVVLYAGIVLRRNFWAATTGELRYPADVRNAWIRGNDVLAQAQIIHQADRDTSPKITWRQFFRGYFATYDAAMAAHHADGNYMIDYPPLRLLGAGLWVKWVKNTYPDVTNWTETKPITEPLLNFNTGAEILGALAAFLLVFRIVYQQRLAPARSFWTRSLLARPPSDVEPQWITDMWLRPTGVLAAVVALVSIGYYAYRAYRLGYWPDWNEQSSLPGATDLLTLLAIFIALVASIQSMTIPYMAWFAGFLAALLVWFNPAMLLDAHAWPQWDCWIIPAYLLAALFVSLDWGFAAGATIAIGCMLKGQLLIGAPILILWPLFAGRFRTAFVTILGFGVTVTLLVSRWTVPAGNWGWIIVLAAVAAMLPLASLFIPWRPKLPLPGTTFYQRTIRFLLHDPCLLTIAILAVVMSGLLIFDYLHGQTPAADPAADPWIRLQLLKWWVLVLLAIAIAAVPWLIRRRSSALIAISVFLAAAMWMAYFRSPGGSTAWYTIGFKYGSDRYQNTIMDYTFNLPAVLYREHRLGPQSEIDLDLPWNSKPYTVALQNIEFGIYGLALLAVSIGAALNQRRRDTRLLLALAAPWVVMFAVMPQMHERYLMYGAVIASACVATGTGDTLICLLLTALATIQIMLESTNAGASTMIIQLRTYLSAADPGLGWVTLVCAGVFIVNSIAPRLRPWAPQPNEPSDNPPDPTPEEPATADFAAVACTT